jgi:hypothetical protein
MSLLAAVFSVLRELVPSEDDPRIGYFDLANLLRPLGWDLDLDTSPDDRNRLWEALGQLVQACRAARVPALSAIVVKRVWGELTHPPGPGIFPWRTPT